MTLTSSESYDFIRTFRMAGYGMIILGPSLHFWFNFVSRLLPKQNLTTTFQKMFMGQTIYGPIMTAVFFSVNAALQGILTFFCYSVPFDQFSNQYRHFVVKFHLVLMIVIIRGGNFDPFI